MNYILGGGMAGLIAAFYNPDFKIISPDIGGQEPLGPRLIQKHPETHRLLRDLGFKDLEVKTAKIGFFYGGKLHTTCPKKLRTEYYIKTRQVKPQEVPASIMSENKTSIEYYDVAWADLLAALYNSVKDRWMGEKVSKITKQKITTNTGVKPYKKLISTLPAPIFSKLSFTKLSCDFSAIDKSFGEASSIFSKTDFDYIYFPEKKISINRATKIDANKWLYEKVGRHDGMQIIPKAQIKQDADLDRMGNIKFIGRYAQWKHNVKIQQVVERSREW